MSNFLIRPLSANDKSQVDAFCKTHWNSEIVVAHGVIYRPADLPGFMALHGNLLIGLVTYHMLDGDCEIVTLDSVQESIGVGTALIAAVRDVARASGARRLWLITTNDNLRAMRFYQKRGFELVAIHRYTVNEARKIKPEIPLIGEYGIPLRDEIELEMRFIG